tara:strand:- start:1202 stop:4579 length:3378 start_codon:yes stop_codon:yes gene_type:complete
MTSKELAHKYQKKSDKQHVLDNPDTYIGSVELVDSYNWLYDSSKNAIVSKKHDYIPGLYKLFDEGIVNARDHVVRMMIKNPVTFINIAIDDEGVITMVNDGAGIDVAMHPEHNVYIPELIFGHLRTSTNYDKTEKKIVGGKNGFGFKLVLIWSEWGMVETVDDTRSLKYVQYFKNNLDTIDKPTITKCRIKAYTKIVFKPDYKRFGIDKLSEDMRNLFIKRIYDIAAITDKRVKVKYNSEIIPIKNFQQYIDMYIGSKDDTKRVYEEANERWEYACCLAPEDEFTHVSFVNGICTNKGGKHVEYILNQIVRKLTAYIKKKKKVDVKANTLKEQLMLFVNCSVENPAFDSQTKDFMNTPIPKFGSTCDVSEKFIEKIANKSGLGVMDMALSLTQVKENKEAKKTDGSKVKSIRGIPKLVDANFAGTLKSELCTLILCEGDSAKAGVISGLSKEDRDIYGVYPLKGKLLNVRDETAKKIADNKEICEIKQIMGLETDKDYTPEEIKTKLRYSRIMFMTDQDLDGSHIKGLGINMFDSLWESLIQTEGFIGFMNTPIIKAKKGTEELLFYNEGQYDLWKESTDTKGWNIKYYKGLGTSTSAEFKEYFKNKKMVCFKWTEQYSKDCIDKVFNKKRADDRKMWLGNYNRKDYLNTDNQLVPYEEFVNREMKHFSKYDNDRSIPNLVDGLKLSLRKILYSAFKKNLNKEIKVAQFSGYVSENSAYHHGEASLNGAIVGMAQDYVGSNNINLLMPNGQFGTRLSGGKDSASERYIFTMLNPITRCIFPQEDDMVLDYLDDDGQLVEPIYYAPIIPLLLVNGSKGIGTGFATDIPSYSPKEIIRYLKGKLNHEIHNEFSDMLYYEGFKGTIAKQEENKFIIKGCCEIIGEDKLRVTELPIGVWTDDYKVHLESLIKDKIVKDFEDNSTEKDVNITIIFMKGQLIKSDEKVLKMSTTKTTTNMHAFDANENLKKYEKAVDIIDEFYTKRLEIYHKRKDKQLEDGYMKLNKLSNKARYIKCVLEDEIDLRKKKNSVIVSLLEDMEFDKVDDNYNYLIKMPMDCVSEENIEKIMKERDELHVMLDKLKNTTVETIWLGELEKLEEEYNKFIQIKCKTYSVKKELIIKKSKIVKKKK